MKGVLFERLFYFISSASRFFLPPRMLGADKKIILVDGEMFSWYGSRLLKAPGYFKILMKEFEQTA